MEIPKHRNTHIHKQVDQIESLEGSYCLRSSSCWALVRGLIPLRSTLSCMWSPFAWIWSLTHSTSSFLVNNGTLALLDSEAPVPTATLLELEADISEVVGQEQDEREDKRKNRKTAATKADRTITGTDTTTPFDIAREAESAIYD